MEPDLETAPDAAEMDGRNPLATGLTALATTKPAPAKKPGRFLTGRFFGRRDERHPSVLAEPGPDPEAGPSGPWRERSSPSSAGTLTAQTSHALLASQVEGAVAYGLTMLPSSPVRATDMSDSQTRASDLPAPSAVDLPLPRMTVPSFDQSPLLMTPTPTTDPTPPAGRASAQLTLGFEITSLQLSPFFRLGAVQLRALSNVVSLHLVAAGGADQPLAAGISFQIERAELGDAGHLKSLHLKPLGESREAAAPVSNLQVESVRIAGEREDAPISVTTSGAASSVVQLVGTFAIAAMEFSPSFEIDSLHLEPVSNTVLLRVAPVSGPDAHKLPSSFEIAEVQLADGAQIRGARLVPTMAGIA